MARARNDRGPLAAGWLGTHVLVCAALAGLASSGCAPSAIQLNPREVAPNQAAIFGRVVVLSKGTAVTNSCKIVFTDQDEQEKTPRLALDSTGWVFTTVSPGPTYLSSIFCDIPNTEYYTGNYETRRLAFQAPGNGRIVYFGDVLVDVQAVQKDTAVLFAAGMARGLTGAVLPGGRYLPSPTRASAAQSMPREEPTTPRAAPMAGADLFAANVQNRFDVAVAQYQGRYGESASALQPETSIAGTGGDAVGILAGGTSPALALGFPLGQPPAEAEARCKGAGFAWQKVEGGGFSCTGAPADLGLPVLVKLGVCGETICQVVADASADGASWTTLMERFGKLTRWLAREHGDKHQREVRALEGCVSGTAGCADSSRVRKSETWRWPDKRQVSLVLDGGPLGGAPSLRIIYREGESQPGR